MTPVEFPYVPKLLNETFITALWDTGAEKSFTSEEVYRKYFSYRPRQKTKDRVVTVQGAPCSHLGQVELQIRIKEFQKPWEFPILDDMQYQCILGIDFMKALRLTLDFDQKSLIISDNQIKQLPKIEKPVDIDLTDTKLGDEQQRQLKALFNNFKGLFSDQPGLTYVLYHDIDTGDKGPVVSRPYRYDRVQQGIINYHIDKMLRDGTICPINSPYASPVVLARKKNDFPPDSPEAYRFAIDYRKLNGIIKYHPYPLPGIDYLLTNIPHTGVMFTLDLKSGYFQWAISPKDIEKMAFITRNAERNYTVTEIECLAVIWALNKFKTYFRPLPVKVISDHAALTKLTNGKNLSSRLIRSALKLSEFNIEWEHRPGVQNVVADLLSRNPVDSVEGSQISCAALRALAINSREQFIREQREDPELGHIYRYLENPDDGSVNATVCKGWSQDFKLINGLFYEKYFSTLGELRVYIPGSLRKDIMKEFHDLPLAGHLGKRKTYLKLRDTCYFQFMRTYIFEYVSTCDRCQKFNYKNALPADRLMPIVSKYPNEIVTLDLLGSYPASRHERYKFIVVICDHFTKWCELIHLRKSSAQAIANALFDNYIARYGAPISLISDNGPQFISDVFEYLSHRLDIKRMKTVTYRPQANLTERVNRNLVQMIASFVEENHENWDQFLHEFAFALRAAGRKQVAKFMPKFGGSYRVLEVKGNNLITWKSGKSVTVNIDQVQVYRLRQTDTISSDSQVETLYDEQGVSHRSNIYIYIDRIKGSLKST
ncbi:transposon Tf2-9 polyprotein [Trichonephila clavipes]|nr:transposon Tf2-9 polyprotein [Trichonephila clavipes]